MPDAYQVFKERGFVEIKPGVFKKGGGRRDEGGKWKPKAAKPSAAPPARPARAPGARGARAAKLEHGDAVEPRRKAPAHAEDAARYVVRVTCWRVRPIDDDNVCEKFVIDCLRYAGLLPDDRHEQARIITWQRKAGCKAEERTEVTLLRRE